MKTTSKIAMLLCLLMVATVAFTACLDLSKLPFVETTPAETTPTETTPISTTPEETTPEETTPEETTPEETTPEETTSPEPVDPDMPEGATLVVTLNGKNARELLEQFIEDFANAKSYDCDAAMSTTVDGVKSKQFMKLQIHNGELALRLESDGIFNGVYFVDGTLYINTNGEKIKMPANSVDEVLGEGALDSLVDEIGAGLEFSKAELEALEDANIYLHQRRYVVTVHTFNEEEERDETSTFYFNDAGELTSANCFFEGGYYMLTLTSYNKPVEINPPADADEYQSFGEPDDDKIPEGALPVDSVNGMNASELLDKFLTEYPKATTFDMETIVQQYVDGEMMTVISDVKIGANGIYFLMGAYDETVEVWAIDSTVYMNAGDQKVKLENASIEDIFGEGMLESIISSAIKEMPDMYYTLVENAQLYYYEDSYFFVISMEFEGTSITETIFFDETGKVICIIDETEDVYMIASINSYGEPVEVLPPEDADEYITESDIS